MKKIVIAMGSDSDWPVMKIAKEILLEFNLDVTVKVVSAHRMPELMEPFCRECEAEGAICIIAGAGGAAHLPGMLASYTYLPVIGVPVKGSSLDGVDSLYSIVQMPRGVPVATVGINNATNAALLATRIAATQDDELIGKLKNFREQQKQLSIDKTHNLI